MAKHNPTWQTTVNNDARKFGHILDFSEAAFALGYEYIAWCGRVYHIWADDSGYIWQESLNMDSTDLK